ncbi:unnamed protein product [Urochloa decumbens]|uniref:RING-type E3 ubiquitin transferase n=1 Tax=Urochloa decumbens TaxID=240449 RepID=A0ABC9CIC5_9POAL
MPSSPRSRHGGHAQVAALLSCALITGCAAQAQDAGDAAGNGQDQQASTAMVALLAAVVAVFVFIAASTVYLRHCSGRAVVRPPPDRAGVVADSAFFASRSWWQRQRRRRCTRGLDAEAVEAFPTMTYAEAKALRVGKGGGGGGGESTLECAVCLSEFEDGERLRLLLPKCSHAFHPDCIAQWLAGHVTCPVCRCNLQPPSNDDKDTDGGQGQPPPTTISVASSISSDTAAALQGGAVPLPVAVVIDIDVVTEEDEEERRQEALELQRIGSQRRAMSGRPAAAEKLARSHGSLAARLDRDLERFTLRLPEHVRREVVAAAAAEHGARRRACREEGGGARSEPLVGRLGSRWQSLIGVTFSGRLSFFSASRVTTVGSGGGGGGEVSSSSSYSYARLGGKRVAAVDAAADVPAQGSISNGVVTAVGGSGGGGEREKGIELKKQGQT